MELTVAKVYDGGEIACGELIMNVFIEMKSLQVGEVLEVVSYDLGSKEDIPAWCRLQGHTLLGSKEVGLIVTHYYIEKGFPCQQVS